MAHHGLRHALMPYNTLDLDLRHGHHGRHHHSSIRVETEQRSYKLRRRTIKCHLPNLYRRLASGGLRSDHHSRELDFTQLHNFSGHQTQKCLRRLFDYLEDLEVRGGQSTLLFDCLVKTLDQSLLEYDHRGHSHISPITKLFGGLGQLLEEHEFGNSHTVFAAMESFFVHRSREICRFLPPREIMRFVYALDGMQGHMSSTLASLKAGMGGGRRLRQLVDHCQRDLSYLSPHTVLALERIFGDRVRLTCHGRHGGGFLAPPRHGLRYDDAPLGLANPLHRHIRDSDLIPKALVNVHVKTYGNTHTYSSCDAPPGLVRATPRRYGGLTDLGPRVRPDHLGGHHHHSPILRDDESLDDDLYDRRDDDHRRRRVHFARSPRRRSFSDDSESSGGVRRGYRSD